MSFHESNQRFEEKLARAILAVKVLDGLMLIVSHIDMGSRQPVIHIVHPHGRLRAHSEIDGCTITWPHDDDELAPYVGERMRDVLAERAIGTLADNVEDAA